MISPGTVANRRWRAKHPDRSKAANRQSRIRNRAARLWNAAKQAAKKRGMEFDLTIERVKRGISAGHCEATGIKFVLTNPVGTPNGYRSPSIDRILSQYGYHDWNVQIVCWGLNVAKHAGCSADMIEMAEAIVANKEKIMEIEVMATLLAR